jgi:hypothetical protein
VMDFTRTALRDEGHLNSILLFEVYIVNGN